MARIAQTLQQRQAILLCQRLAARHTDVVCPEPGDLGNNRIERLPLPAMKRISGVAVMAAQRATGEAHKHGRPAHGRGFALDRQENLGDFEPRRNRSRRTVWQRATAYFLPGAKRCRSEEHTSELQSLMRI